MNYPSGEPVQIGDTVHLGGGRNGVVVGIINEAAYAPGYQSEDWIFLRTGLVVNTAFGDLRLDQPDEDFELVSRPGAQRLPSRSP